VKELFSPSREVSGAGSEANQPGLSALREAVANYAEHQLPSRGKLRRDGIAGLNLALINVPDGLASGLLAGVNPINGLYASITGPFEGGMFSSTRLMVTITTSTASLSAGQVLAGIPSEARDHALFLTVLLVGVIQIVFGLLRLGRLVGFVSYSVMTGFITGIAVLTVLSQIPTVTGCGPTGGNKIIQTLDLLANLGRINLLTLALSVLTLILTVVLPRAWLGNPGILVAIAVPSVLVTLFHMSGVQVVQDIGNIPSGIPTPFLPSPSDLTFDVFTGALAVATIILVQGAGVSQSVPNPDGSRRSVSRDVMADDAANIASGVFQGLPVGGSLGASAINVASEVRTRWAAILAGVWVAVILVAVPGLISYVAMPALGALLIVAGARTIKTSDVLDSQEGRPAFLAVERHHIPGNTLAADPGRGRHRGGALGLAVSLRVVEQRISGRASGAARWTDRRAPAAEATVIRYRDRVRYLRPTLFRGRADVTAAATQPRGGAEPGGHSTAARPDRPRLHPD
jgi:SulP family sulfate permease